MNIDFNSIEFMIKAQDTETQKTILQSSNDILENKDETKENRVFAFAVKIIIEENMS